MNKELIKSRFRKSRNTYEHQAEVQKYIARKLVAQSEDFLPAQGGEILEVGCGTGFLTRALLGKHSPATLWLNDLADELPVSYDSLPSHHSTTWHYLPGDAEQIPFPTHLQAVMAASTVQWFTDLPHFFRKVKRALIPGGLFAFNTFGPNNFMEIRSLLDTGLPYPSAESLCEMLDPAFKIVDVHSEHLVRTFQSPREVLRHLQETGVTGTSTPFSWTPQKLKVFEEEYSRQFGQYGQVTLSWEVLYFICLKR